MIGFDDFGTTQYLKIFESPYVVNTQSTQILHIVVPNLNVSSIGLKNKPKYNIISSINVNSLAGETQIFMNPSNFRYKLQDQSIGFFNILIYDQDFNLVDFNGIDWFIVFTVESQYTPELILPKYLKDEEEDVGTYKQFLKEEEDRNLIQMFNKHFQKK